MSLEEFDVEKKFVWSFEPEKWFLTWCFGEIFGCPYELGNLYSWLGVAGCKEHRLQECHYFYYIHSIGGHHRISHI